MKILKLTAENFKKLVAIEITPQGNVVLLTGKNGAGKSSILDAIMSVFCGKKYQPEKPIREGQEKAEVVITTENYIIKRTFTAAGGGNVTITNADGMKATSPQAMLDKLVGEIAFNPMMFIDYDARKQREILMKLAGLDFSDIDTDIAGVKQKRSEVKSAKETYEHEAARIEVPEQTPDEEVGMADVSAEMQAAMLNNHARNQELIEIENIKTTITHLDETLDNEESLIANLKKQIDEITARHKQNLDLKAKHNNKWAELIEKIGDAIDLEPIQQKIDNLDGVNIAVRKKFSKAEYLKKSSAKSKEFAILGTAMKELEAKKAERLAEAKMPIPGLSVDENGVIYEGIPLAQVNDAKKLEIGVAVGMKMKMAHLPLSLK